MAKPSNPDFGDILHAGDVMNRMNDFFSHLGIYAVYMA